MNRTSPKIMPDFCNRRIPFHFTTALNLLQKMGVDPYNIEILAVGEYENYKGEIRSQKPASGAELGRNAKIVLEVGYTSAIDLMPYQFFYGLAGITNRSSDWENSARRLMAPFDAAFVRYVGISSYEKRKYNFNFIDSNHLLRYLELYDFAGVDISDPQTAARWLAIMPTFHIWAGNAEKMSQILEFLFGYDFSIKESSPSRQNIPDELRYKLGSKSNRLGNEFIIGRSFVEYDTSYEVIISNVPAENVPELLPGKQTRKKIESVLNYCMPGNLDYKIKIISQKDEVKLGKTDQKGYLGYNSYL